MRYYLALILLLAMFFFAVPSIAQAAIPVWTVDEMTRVGKTDAAGSTTTVSLFAAKGEYESYQVVVHAPTGGLSNVNIAVSNLVGPNGASISTSQQTLYREQYVYVSQQSRSQGGTNVPTGPGWFADGLIPFLDPATNQPLNGTIKAANATVSQGENQPYWVDILVPRTATAGTYTGTYTITSDQGQFQGTVNMTVWNFTLPLSPSLHSSILTFHSSGAQADAINVELLKNKLMPEEINPQYETTAISQYGFNDAHMGLWSGANVSTCTMNPAPSVSTIQSQVNLYKQPGVMLYDYSADEIDNCPGLYPTLTQWAVNLHQAGVLQLVTMTPTSALYNDGTGHPVVDIWVVLPKMYDAAPANVNDAISHGMQVWSYNALVQDSYSPKWLIDFAPINYRIMPGFINQTLGLNGILYWSDDLWTSNPWTNPMNYFNGTDSYAGEGMLVYPGAQVGITNGAAPSMRLKWLREGVEDYEYVQLLKNQGKGTYALNTIKTVAPDWKNWSHDPAALESVREQLGQALSAPQATPTSTPATTFNVSVFLHGIGKGGDNSNPTSTGNTSPLTPTRSVDLLFYDNTGQLTTTGTGTVTYSVTTGGFSGSVNVSIPAGTYTIKVATPSFLKGQVPGIQTITPGNALTLPTITLIAGDANNDNALNILDYDLLLGCYSDFTPATSCTPTLKTATDFNDDGAVNSIDYNLYLREVSVVHGQ